MAASADIERQPFARALRQELLCTRDFGTFEFGAPRGRVSATKGMVLFHGRIGSHYAVLGRRDHENICVVRSSDLYRRRHAR